MKLAKAIEVIKRWNEGDGDFEEGEVFEAIQLGVQSMMRLKYIRTFPHAPGMGRLKGETEE